MSSQALTSTGTLPFSTQDDQQEPRNTLEQDLKTCLQLSHKKPTQAMLKHILEGLPPAKSRAKGNYSYSFFDCATRINDQASKVKTQISHYRESGRGGTELQGMLREQEEALSKCQECYIIGYSDVNGKLRTKEYEDDVYKSNDEYPTEAQSTAQYEVLWEGGNKIKKAKESIARFETELSEMKDEGTPSISTTLQA